MKLPYEYIVEHAFHLIDLMACLDGAPITSTLLDEYNDYLIASGWSNFEFDNELISRIDSSWEL